MIQMFDHKRRKLYSKNIRVYLGNIAWYNPSFSNIAWTLAIYLMPTSNIYEYTLLFNHFNQLKHQHNAFAISRGHFSSTNSWKTPHGSPVGATVYPKKYAYGFVVLCFVVVMQSFIMDSHEVFIHIHQGCFAGTGTIVRLPQCQWSKPDGYGKISQCITTRKHSKAKTVCIFLGYTVDKGCLSECKIRTNIYLCNCCVCLAMIYREPIALVTTQWQCFTR